MGTSQHDNSGRQRAVREDHLRNHQRLLDAALELFDTHGLGVTLREIGDRAGVSQAGVYRHFANRDQLIVEVYDQAATGLSTQVLHALSGSRGASTKKRLDLFLDTITAAVAEHPSYGQLAASAVLLYPDRATDPVLVAEITILVIDAHREGLLASDITGRDLVTAAVLAAQTLAPETAPAGTSGRMMTILRRGIAPQAHSIAPMPGHSDPGATGSAL